MFIPASEDNPFKQHILAILRAIILGERGYLDYTGRIDRSVGFVLRNVLKKKIPQAGTPKGKR